MKEVDSVFNTIVTKYYKSKVLSIMPDIAFTLEATRFSKAKIILENHENKMYKRVLARGFQAFRRNISLYYTQQKKLLVQEKHDKARLLKKNKKRS